jgi:hypothetical protein
MRIMQAGIIYPYHGIIICGDFNINYLQDNKREQFDPC